MKAKEIEKKNPNAIKEKGNMQTNDFNSYWEKEFQKVKTMNLSKREPMNYEDNVFLDIYVKYTTWESCKFDKILKAIADYEIRMLFVYPSKNLIVAPYDGGFDVIMESEAKPDEFKLKFKKWLSYSENGLWIL